MMMLFFEQASSFDITAYPVYTWYRYHKYQVNLLVVWIIPHIARSTAEGDLITNVLFYIYSSSFPYYDDVCDTRQVGPAFKSILK